MNVVVFQCPWGMAATTRLAPRCPAMTAGPCSSATEVVVEKDEPFGNQCRLLVAGSETSRRPRRQGDHARRRGQSFFATQPLSQKKVAKRSMRFASITSVTSNTQSSSMVMSQFSITRARMRSPWGASFDFFQPPYLSALIVPGSLQRVPQLHNKADAHIKLLRRRIARGPRFNNSNSSCLRIFRIRSSHPWRPPLTLAHSLNPRPVKDPF